MADCVILFGNNKVITGLKPAGPYTLATRLKEFGFSCECLDISSFLQKIHDIELLKAILRNLIDKETLWLGFSTVFLDKIFDLKIVRADHSNSTVTKLPPIFKSLLEFCKELSPNIRFIVGGSLHIDLSLFGIVQFVGYADDELVKYTVELNQNSSIKRRGRIYCPEFLKFSEKSYIDWTCTQGLMEKEALPIEIARGCIFKCKFCAFPLNGKTKGDWVKQVDLLKREMEEAFALNGTTHFTFCDDTYNDDLSKIEHLNRLVFTKLSFKPKITCYTRIDLIERFPSSAEILAESGLVSTVIGLETNNQASASIIGKGKNFYRQIEFLHKLKETTFKNITVTSGFILGLPKDTRQSWEDLHKFLLSSDNPLDSWNVTHLRLNPSTTSTHRKYFSEFDSNWESYGYEIVDGDKTNPYEIEWDLKSQGFNSRDAAEKANLITKESMSSERFKFGSWSIAGLTSIGIPEDDVKEKSASQLSALYDINQLKKVHMTAYLNKFL